MHRAHLAEPRQPAIMSSRQVVCTTAWPLAAGADRGSHRPTSGTCRNQWSCARCRSAMALIASNCPAQVHAAVGLIANRARPRRKRHCRQGCRCFDLQEPTRLCRRWPAL